MTEERRSPFAADWENILREEERIDLELRKRANDIGHRILKLLEGEKSVGENAEEILRLLVIRSLLRGSKSVKEPGRGLKEVLEVLKAGRKKDSQDQTKVLIE